MGYSAILLPLVLVLLIQATVIFFLKLTIFTHKRFYNRETEIINSEFEGFPIMVNYTNAQLRSILNGLGYRSRLNSNDQNFPISQDESTLTDEATQKAIKKFQIDYDLTVDGIWGQETNGKMQEEMNVIHKELNQVVGTNIPLDQPFYGQLTFNAVQQFQQQNSDGIANFPLREELYQATNQNAVEATQAKATAAKA